MVSTINSVRAINHPAEITSKASAGNGLSHLFGQLFNMGTGLCLAVYGVKEILLDSHPNWFRIKAGPNSPKIVQKVAKAVDWMLAMIRNQPANLLDKLRFTTHGLLMIGTGVATSVSALHRLGAFSVGAALPIFDITAGALFIVGNLIYLEYNIEKFIENVKNISSAGANKKLVIMQSIAAAIGIVSNLTYIAASIATLATAPFLYPLVLGLIGLFTGGLRILIESIIAWKMPPTAQPATR